MVTITLNLFVFKLQMNTVSGHEQNRTAETILQVLYFPAKLRAQECVDLIIFIHQIQAANFKDSFAA